MLVGARLSAVWSHHRAHRFFSHARWSLEAVSATLARLVVRLLVAAEEAVLVAVDDTLFGRRGPKVWSASWFHDGSAKGDKTPRPRRGAPGRDENLPVARQTSAFTGAFEPDVKTGAGASGNPAMLP
jgi:hypothetical protein